MAAFWLYALLARRVWFRAQVAGPRTPGQLAGVGTGDEVRVEDLTPMRPTHTETGFTPSIPTRHRAPGEAMWGPPVVHGVSRWSSHLGADRWPGDAKSYFAAVRSPRARRQWSGVSSWIREAGWSGMRSITSIRYTSGSVP